MKSFTGHYAGKSSLGLRRADLFRDAWQHCRRLPQPLLKEKLRGHWTLPYVSKPEKIPFGFWRRTGPAGKMAWVCCCAPAIPPIVARHVVPAGPSELADNPGALGEDEILQAKLRIT